MLRPAEAVAILGQTLHAERGAGVSNANLEQRLGAIESREAIRARLLAYCRGIDRRDTDLVLATFWPDSQVEYGIFNGGGEEFARSICGWLGDSGCDRTSHQLGNISIAVTGDSAISESYLTAYHRIRGEGGVLFDCIIGARYHDRFERREGMWRISFRRLVYDWFRTFPDSGSWDVGAMGVTSGIATIGAASLDVWPELNEAMRGVTVSG